jgi:hypothetical protein
MENSLIGKPHMDHAPNYPLDAGDHHKDKSAKFLAMDYKTQCVNVALGDAQLPEIC